MAETFLEEIYKEAYLITELKWIAELAMYQDIHAVRLRLKNIIPDLNELLEKYAGYNVKQAFALKEVVEQSINMVGKNLVVAGDNIEKEVIPKLKEYIGLQGNIRVENEEGDYLFESTDSGFLTIKNIIKDEYLHSTVDPMWEAKKMAKYIFDPKKREYAIRGCGLGYLAYQLYLISEKSAIIHIFEGDKRMVDYAKSYGVINWIPEENLKLVVDKDILSFLYCAERENTTMYISQRELEYVPKDTKQAMEKLYMEYVTEMRFNKNVKINFYRNIESNSKLVSKFDTSKYNKEYVIVAAGPSLDDTLDFVRESMGKRTIVAVGTVFKKLMEQRIIPDMVVILDPQERTYKQIEGLEEQKVPILLATTAYWKFADAYQGEKYLVPIAQIPEIKEYAIEKNENLWGCGGTVTSLGIEAAIRFGAKKIYLVGVDLAYPQGISHALGTIDRRVKDVEKMIPVENVNGEIVYTEPNFKLYKENIEKRIQETPDIIYYNMSKIGIKIKGAKPWNKGKL